MAELLAINENVPIPARRGGIKKYPWNEMNVGDSFVVESGVFGSIKVQRRLASSASRFKPKKFTTRITYEGVRVWRVE